MSSLSGPLLSGEGPEFSSLTARGNRLGDDDQSTYEERTVPLLPTDLLVFFTDGIVECESEAGEELGEKRFRAMLRRAGEGGDPAAVRDRVVAEATAFFGERPRKDDITLVLARLDG
jgi:serine phosphatase RsbU (regulator of sigma subunit)